MEKEKLWHRHQELMQQELMIREGVQPMAQMPTNPTHSPDPRPLPSSTSDPFLSSSGPFHSREASADSGLGMGNYSLSRTPEELLSSLDEMDTGAAPVPCPGSHFGAPTMGQPTAGNPAPCAVSSQQSMATPCAMPSQQSMSGPCSMSAHHPSSGAHSGPGLVFPDLLEPESMAMDSDELVASLSDSLVPEILGDVEAVLGSVASHGNRDSLITWL